nr:hypothetical protein [Sphingobium fuliginis]
MMAFIAATALETNALTLCEQPRYLLFGRDLTQTRKDFLHRKSVQVDARIGRGVGDDGDIVAEVIGITRGGLDVSGA